MKRILVLCLAVALCGLAGCHKTPARPAAPVAQAVPPAADPKAFLQALYANYDGRDHSFSPLGDKAADYFDPDMLGLMSNDAKVTPAGDVGALDGDPICDCQDFGALKAAITVHQATATHATAVVTITETDTHFGDTVPQTLTYDLVLVNGAWRIHDITSASTPSLRALFVEADKGASNTPASA